MDDPVEDVDTGLLGVTEFGVGVLLDGEDTGELGDVEVGDTGGGEEEEEAGEDDGAGDDGVGEDGVVRGGEGRMEVADGLGVVVVPDPPVIVNCGLALPESPNTSGEEAHAKSARGEVVAST